MYKIRRQLSIDDFIFPYGKLKADNRWVKMADLIPWDDIEKEYAVGFVNNGAPAHPARLALGSLIVKQALGCSDEELVCQVAENAYIQFFIGLGEFQEECPFGASTLVAFRKRFTEENIAQINEAILARQRRSDTDGDDTDGTGSPPAERTMTLDATVAPSDIAYPQDMRLLSEAREHLEKIIDFICAQSGSKKPRMYRNIARKDYLVWSKSKRRTPPMTRKAIRKQLGYVSRDLTYIEALVDEHACDLDARQVKLLETIATLHYQQSYMYEMRTHSVADRIVSIPQPWVRPMVRNKAKVKTEFGAKVSVSCDDKGFARIEGLSFDAFNESDDLIRAVEAYRKREGCWPERVLADKIYRNRANLVWCKERNVRLSGPKLGRPPKDAALTKEAKTQERMDAADRNTVEGVFGTAKRTYGLDPVAARLEETTKTVIGLSILVFNLKKLLVASLAIILEAVASILRHFELMLSDCRRQSQLTQVI